MAIYTWNFGSDDGSLKFTVVYDAVAGTVTVTSGKGELDVNAFWFSDGTRRSRAIRRWSRPTTA